MVLYEVQSYFHTLDRSRFTLDLTYRGPEAFPSLFWITLTILSSVTVEWIRRFGMLELRSPKEIPATAHVVSPLTAIAVSGTGKTH